MENNLFNSESGMNEEEFSNAGGRRKECKAKGIKPNTKEFRACLKGLRSEDKGKSRADKKATKKTRKGNYDDALAQGKVKKTGFGKAFGFIKKANPAFVIMRGAFLGLLRLNAWGLSNKIDKLQALSKTNQQAKKTWYKILAHWIKFGGDKNKLIKNINIGKKKKPLLIRKSKLKERGLGFDGDRMDGFDELFSYATGVEEAAASTPVWVPIVKLVIEAGGVVGGLLMSKKDKDAVLKEAEKPEYQLSPQDIAAGEEAAKEIADKQQAKSEKILGMPSIAVYGFGGLILVGIIVLIFKNKK